MTSLATIDPDRCPTCGEPVTELEYQQPALIRHGGYGATERTTYVYCSCGWSVQRERTEVKP